MRTLISALFLGFSLILAPATGHADNASNAADYQSALSDNLKVGSSFLAGTFGKGLAFALGSQAFSPVSARPLLGFNLGLSGGASFTKIDKADLLVKALNNGTDLQGQADGLPDQLPLPLALLNAHIGLPKFLIFEKVDLGLRGGDLDLRGGELNAKISALGAELRGNVFDAGLLSPVTLTLGLGWDRLNTQLHFSKDQGAYSANYNGSTISGDTRSVADLDSQLDQWSLKATVSRKFLFFTPYAGAAFNLISGENKFRSAQEGTLTFSNGLDSDAQLTQAIEGVATELAPSMDLRLGAGFELSFFAFYLGVGGEYGVVSGGAGGNIQMGLSFR